MKKIKNYMEDLVEQFLIDLIKDMDICKCEQCRADIEAIALNNLPTKYVVTDTGKTYSKTNILVHQFEVDIISEVTKAAEIVKRSPRHD